MLLDMGLLELALAILLVQIQIYTLGRLGLNMGKGTNVPLPQGDFQPAHIHHWIQSGLCWPR